MTLDLIPSEQLRALRSLSYIAGLFKALGLVWAYQNMISIADEGMKRHPETRRVPEMRTLLLDYFVNNYTTLINTAGNRIFPLNSSKSGMESLFAWQHAGYPTKRTRGNHLRRLRYWQAIYDGTDLIVERKLHPVTGKPLKSKRGEVFSDKKIRKTKTRYANLGRVKDKEGNIITYEYVISRRNKLYGATATSVPFWYVLNYGTRGGYPEVAGIHFIERAEKDIDLYLMRSLDLYERYALGVLTGDVAQVSFMTAADWLRRRGFGSQKGAYLDVVDAALDVAVANVF